MSISARVCTMERVSVVVLCVLSLITAETDLVSKEPTACQECEVKIPLDMALKLNTITDENQLFREFIKDVEAPLVKSVVRAKFAGIGPDSVADRFGGVEDENVERKAFSKPKPAGCIPELRTVSLRDTDDPWIFSWPSCTRIEQCGGCCSHKLLSCQPVETELLNFQVVVTEYVGNKLQYKGKEIVTREKHTKCRCDCITKPSDCNQLQDYSKGECRCLCKNKDAQEKCKAEEDTKRWNPDTCSCQCLKVFECSTGTFFNEVTCSCEVLEDTRVENQEKATEKTPFRRKWPINYFFGNGK